MEQGSWIAAVSECVCVCSCVRAGLLGWRTGGSGTAVGSAKGASVCRGQVSRRRFASCELPRLVGCWIFGKLNLLRLAKQSAR